MFRSPRGERQAAIDQLEQPKGVRLHLLQVGAAGGRIGDAQLAWRWQAREPGAVLFKFACRRTDRGRWLSARSHVSSSSRHHLDGVGDESCMPLGPAASACRRVPSTFTARIADSSRTAGRRLVNVRGEVDHRRHAGQRW